MISKSVFILFVLLMRVATAQDVKIIDYGKFPSANDEEYKSLPQDMWEMGFYAFNRAPELTLFFGKLKADYHLDCAVETGTFHAWSTVALSRIFDQVHTIEIKEEYHKENLKKLKNIENIQCHLGSSEETIARLLPNLRDHRILFYLDAHWGKYCPLVDEIRAIGRTHRDRCVIVIDDFKVPGREDIPYDSYPRPGGERFEIAYETIQAALDEAFSDYEISYVIPIRKSSRAKAVIVPKNQ